MERTRLGRLVAATTALALALVGLSAAPAFAANVTVSGTVTLASTNGPAGANDVYVRVIQGGVEKGAAMTQSNGTYSISNIPEGSAYRVYFTSYRDDSQSIWSTGQSLIYDTNSFTISGPQTFDVVMPKAGKVSGTVTLQGATGDDQVTIKYWNCITYTYRNCAGTASSWKTAQTDASGHFELTDMAEGYWVLEARHSSGLYFDKARPDAVQLLVDQSHVALTTSVDLARKGTVSGQVTLADGRIPVADEIEIYEDNGFGGEISRGTVNAGGSYQVTDLVPGVHVLYFRNKGAGSYKTTSAYAYFVEPNWTQTKNVTMPTQSQVSGTVREADGTPVGEGLVVMKPWSAVGPQYTAVVQADGSYRMTNVAPGEYITRVQFASDSAFAYSDFTGYSQRLILDDDDNVTNRDEYVFRTALKAVVWGQVLDDASGDPLADVTIEVQRVDEDQQPIGSPSTATTDASGKFLVSGLVDNERYIVTVSLDGYVPYVYGPGSILGVPSIFQPAFGGRYLKLAPRLTEGATVSGTITSPAAGFDAEAAAGNVTAEVYTPVEGSGLWEWTGYGVATDEDGAYELQLPEGDYRIQGSLYGNLGEAAVRSQIFELETGDTETFSPVLRPFLRDLTGDLAPDLVARTTAGKLYAYAGDGVGGFLPSKALGTGWGTMTAIVNAGDFDRDGLADVIARDSTGKLWLYPGHASGGLTTRTLISSGWNSQNVILSPGDLTGDGRPDLVTRDTSGVLWQWPGGATPGTVGTRVQIGTGWKGMTAVAVAGDFDEDGVPDIVGRDLSGALWLYVGDGGRGFMPRVKLGTGWTSFTAIVGVGDFDGDWHPDLITRDAAGALWVYPGLGGGQLGTRYKIATGWKTLAIAS